MTSLVHVLSLLATLATLCSLTNGKAEEFVPPSEVGEGTHCDEGEKIANTCLSCAALEGTMIVPLPLCCTKDDAYKACEACIARPEDCPRVMSEYQSKVATGSDVNSDDRNIDDRYGSLFAKDSDVYGRKKRFGTLFLGTPRGNKKKYYFGKRSGIDDESVEIDNDDLDKFGLLKSYLENAYDSSDLSSESFEDADNDDEMNDFSDDIDKRYGRLYLGSGSYFGKRQPLDTFPLEQDEYLNRALSVNPVWYGDKRSPEDFFPVISDVDKSAPLGLDWERRAMKDYVKEKRYGSLSMGSGGYFGKRGLDDDGDDYDDGSTRWDMDKRFGRLFMGSGRNWKRGANYMTPLEADLDKRYGRLYMGSGSTFGKRNTALRDTDLDKRYGSLFMGSKLGKRGRRGLQIDRRFGRLYLGRLFGRY